MQRTDWSIFELFIWIAWGGLVFGTLGWMAAVFLVPSVPTPAGLIAGVAAGGSVGAVVRLLVFSDVEETTETVTFDVGEDEPPGPEPVDLFEAHPDPLVYYDSTAEPVVLASNPAFTERFGVDGATIEHGSLAAGLVGGDIDALVEAADDGRSFTLDQPVADENGSMAGGSSSSENAAEDADDGTIFRVRVIPVGADGMHGYVQYTSLSGDR